MKFHKTNIWGNSGFSIMSQNALRQSGCSILNSAISQKQLMNKLDFWHVDIDVRNIKDDL